MGHEQTRAGARQPDVDGMEAACECTLFFRERTLNSKRECTLDSALKLCLNRTMPPAFVVPSPAFLILSCLKRYAFGRVRKRSGASTDDGTTLAQPLWLPPYLGAPGDEP